MKKYGIGRFCIDLGLTMVTGGIWALYLIFKYLYSNS